MTWRSPNPPVLHRDRIVEPPTQPVVKEYWWELLYGGHLCGDGLPTVWVVWKRPLTLTGSTLHYWSSMVRLHLASISRTGRVAPTNYFQNSSQLSTTTKAETQARKVKFKLNIENRFQRNLLPVCTVQCKRCVSNPSKCSVNWIQIQHFCDFFLCRKEEGRKSLWEEKRLLLP